MIRQATIGDASRIAEISIFTKRINYRSIFHDDIVSFGKMQVYPLAKEYIDNPGKLEGIWRYTEVSSNIAAKGGLVGGVQFQRGFVKSEKEKVLRFYTKRN